MSREVMQQALEALRRCDGRNKSDEGDRHRAITALRQALAEPEQEPVNRYCCHACFTASGCVLLDRMILCPECGNKRCPKASNHLLPCTASNEPGQTGSVYTHPPQRTEEFVCSTGLCRYRKPLKDEAALKLWGMRSDGPENREIIDFARAIERVHGIKQEEA